jgi:hypothetical protein
VVYALRSLGLTRFNAVQGILRERAADWHPRVRFEVATVLCEWDTIHRQEVDNLLMSWLQGEGEERHWTALWAILRLGSERPGLLETLHKLAEENQDLRVNTYELIIDILEQEDTDEQILRMFGVLVRENAPRRSFIIIQPMIEALDRRLPSANSLIASWQSDARPKLQQAAQVISEKLEMIHTERRQRWQTLLRDSLYNEAELGSFSDTLPPHDQDAFWNDVHAKREERERRRNRWKRAIVIFFVLLCLALCCASPFICAQSPEIQSFFEHWTLDKF